ncbi:MAG: hypothetical protein LBO20_04215 [Bifidobacteriaceae bacterium]|nr:hypothetical protein [Bifidobacteriaceae bacterium]
MNLLDAAIGAVVGGVVAWLLTVWQLKRQRAERLADARLDLVRRIARHESGAGLANGLNEVPVVFADDPKALELYMAALSPKGQETEMELVVVLLEHLAAEVGLPVNREHLAGGFSSK